MITDTSATNTLPAVSSPQGTGNSATATEASADFENFLKLLTAQLRNQDPLSPLDSTQFVAQLASFSTVEQLVKANERLDAIAASGAGDALQEFSDWIGKQAETSETSALFDGTPIEFRLNSLPEADHVELVVYDAGGFELSRFAAANSTQPQVWNGAIAGGQAALGEYLLVAEYFNGPNIIQSEQAAVFRRVDEVRVGQSGLEIGLGGGVYIRPDQVSALRS